jgi:predicted transcriptional regulator
MKEKLTRREQQAMDVIYRDGRCDAHQVQSVLGISYSAARAVLSRLVDKGVLQQQYDGPRYVYFPAHDLSTAKTSALRDLVSTLFQGSAVDAMGALLAMSKDRINDQELARLEAKIRQAREQQGNRR